MPDSIDNWFLDALRARIDRLQRNPDKPFNPIGRHTAIKLIEELDKIEHEMILVRAENVRLRAQLESLDNPPRIDAEAWGGGPQIDCLDEEFEEDESEV